jgi:hypothetical protein
VSLGLLDGGQLTSASVPAYTYPVSITCGFAGGGGNLGSAQGTLMLLASNDNVNFAPVANLDAGVTLLNNVATAVAISSGTPFPYAYVEATYIPTTGATDGGQSTSCVIEATQH